MSSETLWTITVGRDTTSAEYEAAPVQRAVFVCAHGAGGNLRDRATVAAARTLRGAGLGVVRFNFLYKEHGKGGPDRMPRLMECYRAVLEHVRRELSPRHLIIGGRSMGGRTASMLAAEDVAADGLLLLAYPLHPPGRKESPRTEHLPAIRMPVLCFNGTRDDFCDPDLMRAAVGTVQTRWTMHWLEHADHSFHVQKKSGRTDAEVLAEVASATDRWLGEILPP